MGKWAVLSLSDKKEVCTSKVQLQLNIANHSSKLWDKPVNRKCTGDMLGEKKVVEALVIWKGQLNVKNGTAKNEVIEEEAKMFGKYCILSIKCSSNMLLFYNKHVFITLNNVTGLNNLWYFNLLPPLIQCNEL